MHMDISRAKGVANGAFFYLLGREELKNQLIGVILPLGFSWLMTPKEDKRKDDDSSSVACKWISILSKIIKLMYTLNKQTEI